MNYGLYMSSSAVLTGMHLQDVAANNLANVNTVGFKAGLASIQSRDAESIEDRLGVDMAHQLLDKLGGGVLLRPSKVDTSNGALDKTENPLDVGIDRDGF
ncbi:MAG: flagellar basal body protein, partial [Planctomycetota bacterium]